MHTFDVPVAHCPNCGKLLEACTAVLHNNAPAPGSLTVCFYCAALLQFNPVLGLVQLKDLPSDCDDETRRVVARIRAGVLEMQQIRD